MATCAQTDILISEIKPKLLSNTHSEVRKEAFFTTSEPTRNTKAVIHIFTRNLWRNGRFLCRSGRKYSIISNIIKRKTGAVFKKYLIFSRAFDYFANSKLLPVQSIHLLRLLQLFTICLFFEKWVNFLHAKINIRTT
jgi:hypothetical protein